MKGFRLGLRGGRIVAIETGGPGLLVKAERANEQLLADEAAKVKPPVISPSPGGTGTGTEGISPGKSGTVTPPPPPPPQPPVTQPPNHFFGSVTVDSTRISRDVETLDKEIVQHLACLPGAVVKVTVEIQADIPQGAPPNTVRTVSENCKTLKFTNHGFELG